jgi:hypothetical protein
LAQSLHDTWHRSPEWSSFGHPGPFLETRSTTTFSRAVPFSITGSTFRKWKARRRPTVNSSEFILTMFGQLFFQCFICRFIFGNPKLADIGKPVSVEKVKQAFLKMLEILK